MITQKANDQCPGCKGTGKRNVHNGGPEEIGSTQDYFDCADCLGTGKDFPFPSDEGNKKTAILQRNEKQSSYSQI